MVTLAVLPGMLRISLVVANLANPGNSSRAINLLVSQRGIVGLFPVTDWKCITPATKIRTNPNSRLRLPGDQRSTTESTEIHGKENPNQLPLSVSFPGATPARRVGSFRGYPFVMIFLAGVILSPIMRPPSYRQRLFVEHDLGGSSGSAALAARRAGYPWPEQMARKMLRNVEKRGVQAARNGPSEDSKCWQRIELGIHGLKSCD